MDMRKSFTYASPERVQWAVNRMGQRGADAAIAAGLRPIAPKHRPDPERLKASAASRAATAHMSRAKLQDVHSGRFLGVEVPATIQQQILWEHHGDPWIDGFTPNPNNIPRATRHTSIPRDERYRLGGMPESRFDKFEHPPV